MIDLLLFILGCGVAVVVASLAIIITGLSYIFITYVKDVVCQKR